MKAYFREVASALQSPPFCAEAPFVQTGALVRGLSILLTNAPLRPGDGQSGLTLWFCLSLFPPLTKPVGKSPGAGSPAGVASGDRRWRGSERRGQSLSWKPGLHGACETRPQSVGRRRGIAGADLDDTKISIAPDVPDLERHRAVMAHARPADGARARSSENRMLTVPV
jgi:hypothetical protein